MADLVQLEEQIVALSLLEAAALVKKLEERLGFRRRRRLRLRRRLRARQLRRSRSRRSSR